MASTSGEDKDVQLFRAACRSHFYKVATSVSEERFTELFTEGGVSKEQCKKLYKAFHSAVVEDLMECVDKMISEEGLSEKFAKRRALLEAQKEFEGKTAWRPTGQPQLDLRSHDMQALLRMKTALQEYLNERKAHVDGLFEKVLIARKSTADVQKSIKSLNRQITQDDERLDEIAGQYTKTLNALASSGQERKTNEGSS